MSDTNLRLIDGDSAIGGCYNLVMFRIRIWLAAVGGVAFALPAWAEECRVDSRVCFGISWKTVSIDKIARSDFMQRLFMKIRKVVSLDETLYFYVKMV